MPHLLVDITAHGYGHIAQTAPVVNELVRRMPNLRVTVRSAASTDYLQQRFTIPFQHIHTALDFGMTMFNAVDVDVPRSLENYREYHADWEAKVELAANEMRALQPDLLFANVPYLSLAAAQVAQIPAVAMCCLNWADIYQHYAPDDAASHAIHAQMLAAYNSAQPFLKVSPTMPMHSLSRARGISPIAQLGINQRERVGGQRTSNADGSKSLNPSQPPLVRGGAGFALPLTRGSWRGLDSGDLTEIDGCERWVLIAMGGIDYRLPMENWPRISGVRYLVPQAWNVQRDDTSALETMGMSFSDLLASCDAVLTKPGYGTFAEAACAGIPVLYVSRGEWPEQPYLIEWLAQHGVCREVSAAQLHSGELEKLLQQLWQQTKPGVPTAGGAVEAADVLARYL